MLKNIDTWIGSYTAQTLRRLLSSREFAKPTHVMFCFVDHFEPDWKTTDKNLQRQRVERWVREYPALAQKHKDADGCSPKHTFFYPAECYTSEHFDLLRQLCQKNFGEVEIHLHHDNDTEETLEQKLIQAKKDFSRHGFLGRRKLSGDVRFAFIHGNWALNNSRKDGCFCGVNDEAKVLAKVGCYADFTLPSAPSETQTRKINSIYYTKSSRHKPKSHDKGVDVTVGKFCNGDLMLIQGPLALNLKIRKKGFFPAIENADITGANHPTRQRVDLWVDQRISVKDKEDWVFIKVHTHGAPEKNADALLGKPLD